MKLSRPLSFENVEHKGQIWESLTFKVFGILQINLSLVQATTEHVSKYKILSV